MTRTELVTHDLDALLGMMAKRLMLLGETLLHSASGEAMSEDSLESIGTLLSDEAEHAEFARKLLCKACRMKEMTLVLESKEGKSRTTGKRG